MTSMIHNNKKHIVSRIVPIIFAAIGLLVVGCSDGKSTKAERNFIKAGNEHFANKDYGSALNRYEDALTESPKSEPALFNKANSLVHIGMANPDDSVSAKNGANIYNQLAETSSDVSLREKSNYNLASIAFHAQDYQKSIEYYKKVLRSNPGNMRARENLRVAQLKLPPQDENQNQQDQQDQQQNQEQQQQEQQQQPQEQQQQEQQQEMSQNAEQILQSMQNRENQTRQETQKAQPARPSGTDKPW